MSAVESILELPSLLKQRLLLETRRWDGSLEIRMGFAGCGEKQDLRQARLTASWQVHAASFANVQS